MRCTSRTPKRASKAASRRLTIAGDRLRFTSDRRQAAREKNASKNREFPKEYPPPLQYISSIARICNRAATVVYWCGATGSKHLGLLLLLWHRLL
jgi:hypothetical protein